MSDGEIIQTIDLAPSRGYVEAATRGEVDMQVSTARRFPRSVKTFKERALSLATLDEETAASCFYSLPRGGKPIEGPSARLAEIVAASWGNIRSQACVVDIDNKFVTAKGTCWDLENNTAVSVEVQRRITDKSGRRYNDDMIGVTANAACAIALRNAIFKVVPMAMVKPIYDKAREVAIGNAETLVARRAKMVAHFGKMHVQPAQIFAKVDKASVEDITLDDLAILIGLATAIKDGDTTVDDAFPPLDAPKKDANGTKSDELAAKLKKPERVSRIKEVEKYLKDGAIPCVDANPEGTSMKFELPNGEFLVVSDAPPKATDGLSVVDAMDPDCVSQVTNIVEKSRKKR